MHRLFLSGSLTAVACFVATVLACSEPTASSAAPPSVASAPTKAKTRNAGHPDDEDSYYGVYLNGHKTGWMHSTLVYGTEVKIALELVASVGGMGTVAKIRLNEERVYRAKDGALISLSFEQRAATGAMHAVGKVIGDELHLEITAGNRTTEQVVPVQESLEDALAASRLARRAKVGETRHSRRFDISVLKLIEGVHEVVAVRERSFGGIVTKTVNVESRYPSLEITESAWFDEKGRMLESMVGGFFVARLESPDVAKRLDYSQDLLVSAVVAAPPEVAAAASGERLTLTFTGFGDSLPPSSPRQGVTRDGEHVIVKLRRGTMPTGLLNGMEAADDPFLESTPFIQSSAPEIRAKAREVIAGATELSVAIRRLTTFVYNHVEDEYIPAYSNALDALASGRGDCTEHSILFVALARAAGIPARVAVGIAYWAPGNGFGWHAWAEVRSASKWYAVDPTWNQPIADVSHVKLASGGPAEQARIVMMLGRLRVIDAATR